MKFHWTLFVFAAAVFRTVSATVWCYSCVSNQPGCGEEIDWRIHRSITCDTTCVKIVEERGSEKFITRDCLSNIQGLKTDIPGDTFEGCRAHAPNPKLAVDVSNSLVELNLKQDYYDETTYCFCNLDHWCNQSNSFKPSCLSIIGILITYFVFSHFVQLS